MSTTYDLSRQIYENSWILYCGQLVRVRQNCFEQDGVTGIIIECVYPDFGTGADKWLVLIDGELILIESFKLWPFEENNEKL